MLKNAVHAVCVAAVIVCLAGTTQAEDPYQIAWKRQIGTTNEERIQAVAVDPSGNVYMSGYTRGDLGGPNQGYFDAFLLKCDPSGNELWRKQIGTSGADGTRSLAVDASGNAYISGWTEEDLGGPYAGGTRDAFLSKFDSAGNEIWMTQFGTNSHDLGYSVALDASGGIYVSGQTGGDLGGTNSGSDDAFVSKFDSAGNEVWTTQFGTGQADQARSVALDASGNIYVGGWTMGNLGGSHRGKGDAFLSKFDSGGNQIWARQVGTSNAENSYSAAVDGSGDIYICGVTKGHLAAPNPNINRSDAFFSKFDSEGNELWTRQIGTDTHDAALGVTVDATDAVYITGYTAGSLGGSNAGSHDVLLIKLNSDGYRLWTTQIGTSTVEMSHSITSDASGNIFVGGHTLGALGGPNRGYEDAFFMKYEVPEPATFALLALGGLAVLRRRRRQYQSHGE